MLGSASATGLRWIKRDGGSGRSLQLRGLVQLRKAQQGQQEASKGIKRAGLGSHAPVSSLGPADAALKLVI